MKTQSIMPLQKNISFNGLWGKKTFVNRTSLGKVICENYNLDYHPFADETQSEINSAIKKHINALNSKSYNPNAIEKECYNAVIKPQLLITKKDYAEIISGRIPKSILRIEKAMKSTVEMLINRKI